VGLHDQLPPPLDARERLGAQLRATIRTRLDLLRAYWRPILQVALAAAVAWELGVLLLPTEQPVFAAVMAVVSLGVAMGQRGRLAVEMVLGVAVGLGVADLTVNLTGRGAIELGVLAALAMVVAVLLGGGPNLIGQAGVWAILVSSFSGPGSLYPEALLESLLGGAVALVFSQLLFPLNPVKTSSRATHLVCTQLAERLRDGTAALRDGDEARASSARLGVLALERHVADMGEALAMSTGAARLAPPRRKARGHVESYRRVAFHIELAVQDAGSLLAAVARLIRHEEHAPGLDAALDHLAVATERLCDLVDGTGRSEQVRRSVIRAVGEVPDEFDAGATPTTLVAWAQVQGIATHLLVAAGLQEHEAREVIGDAARGAMFDRLA
jgi:hypothetical protein